MGESQITSLNEMIKNSIESAFLLGRRKERKLIGKWLEYAANNKTPEELEELLNNAIECLKRDVFPDPL